MESKERWFFTKEELENTPSRKCGCDAEKELSFRQQAANFIQDMGQRLLVSQLCINTAIVYMHRFYVFHSFTLFHRNAIAVASLFLAAKVEEQPRRLEHIIKVAYLCLNRARLDTRSPIYIQQSQELVVNENLLLQTLGFDVAIDHPHTHVVRCCHLVRATKDLSRASYFLASNSLHLTTMCLQYKPTIVACFCIHLACKWSNWKIPKSSEGKEWYWYIDKSATPDQLEQLTAEFLAIVDKCPTKLKHRMQSIKTQEHILMNASIDDSALHGKRRRVNSPCAESLWSDQKMAGDGTCLQKSIFNTDLFKEPLNATTSKDYPSQKPSPSSYTTFCHPASNSLLEQTLPHSSERMKTHSVEFTRGLLDSHATIQKRDSAANNAKRSRFDVMDGSLDHIAKQYRTGGTKKYLYTNLR